MSNFIENIAFSALENFVGISMRDNYALPSHFEVIISPPTKFGGGGFLNQFFNSVRTGNNAREVSLRCSNVAMPGRNLTTVTDSNIYGPTREIVENVSFAEDVTLSFQASQNLKEREFFESWQQQAFNATSFDVGYYFDYVGQVDIFLLDQNNRRQYGCRLNEAFPKTIGQVDLDATPATGIIALPVSMSFRTWDNLDRDRTPLQRFIEDVVDESTLALRRNLPPSIRSLL